MTVRALSTAGAALLAVSLLVAGCGRRHESAIGKGFTFIDLGGNDKKIVFEHGDGTQVVIDARVDAYTRDASKIVAARRPLKAANQGSVALQPVCEYWIIDLNTRVAHRIPDAAGWPDIHCEGP